MDIPRTPLNRPQPAEVRSPAADAAGKPEDLARLLRQTGQGDKDAFASLYQSTSRRVFGLVKRVLVDVEMSADTTQEVYLQVWTSAARYDPAAGGPLTWLMTIAHRRAVDRVRAEQSNADREARYASASHAAEHDEVVEAVTHRLESEAVVKCLDGLTGTQQESVRLAYYGGLTYREVAEKLGVAIPTIKSRIRDGLLRLKTCLGVS